MLTVNGIMVDVRHLPIEVQEDAYQKGLIPYFIQPSPMMYHSKSVL
jgi:hypothetical protein